MFKRIIAAIVVALCSGSALTAKHAAGSMARYDFRGGSYVASQRVFYAWGDGLWRFDISQEKVGEPFTSGKKIADGGFNEGGCVTDINGDGKLDFVLQKGPGLGDLVWLDGRTRKSHVIDTDIEMHDCLATTLLGHKGILITQRGMQIRFYERGATDKWVETEIYSFYTPSYQTSFIQADVDGDGYPDLFCGNYWMKSPERFDLPWHIFAINTYSETPISAMLRLALLSPNRLIAAQGHMTDARLTLFVKPEDVHQQWIAHRLDGDLHLAYPHALIALSDSTFVVGEHNGSASRFIYFRVQGTGEFSSEIVEKGPDTLALWCVDPNIRLQHGSGGVGPVKEILALGPHEIRLMLMPANYVPH